MYCWCDHVPVILSVISCFELTFLFWDYDFLVSGLCIGSLGFCSLLFTGVGRVRSGCSCDFLVFLSQRMAVLVDQKLKVTYTGKVQVRAYWSRLFVKEKVLRPSSETKSEASQSLIRHVGC